MQHSNQSVDNYKNILREAVEVSQQLSVKTKQEILQFKEKLQEYISLVNSVISHSSSDPEDSNQAQDDTMENENQLNILKEDLDRLGSQIHTEVATVKQAFK